MPAPAAIPAPPAAAAKPAAAKRRRLGLPRIVLVGCGEVGLRIVARLRDRYRVFGTVTSPASAALVRAAGAVPLMLDLDTAPRSGRRAARIAGLAGRVMVLAPTSTTGRRDRRARRLLGLLGRAPGASTRLLYISTTGVYGDRRGAWTDETTPAAPANDRAARRLDAENVLRHGRPAAAVLRVPGIYAADRLPLARLREAIPVPMPAEDVFTNHIHADDLARACIAALHRGAPARSYNIIDDSALLLGQYLDLVADHSGLARPPRAPWEAMRQAAGPQRMSFMGESRRIRNARMKRELRLRLRYPDVPAGLAAARSQGAAAPGTAGAVQASKSPSTDR